MIMIRIYAENLKIKISILLANSKTVDNNLFSTLK